MLSAVIAGHDRDSTSVDASHALDAYPGGYPSSQAGVIGNLGPSDGDLIPTMFRTSQNPNSSIDPMSFNSMTTALNSGQSMLPAMYSTSNGFDYEPLWSCFGPTPYASGPAPSSSLNRRAIAPKPSPLSRHIEPSPQVVTQVGGITKSSPEVSGKGKRKRLDNEARQKAAKVRKVGSCLRCRIYRLSV